MPFSPRKPEGMCSFHHTGKNTDASRGLRQLNRKIYVLTELCLKITSNLSTYQTCIEVKWSAVMCSRKIYTFLIVAKRKKAAWNNLIVETPQAITSTSRLLAVIWERSTAPDFLSRPLSISKGHPLGMQKIHCRCCCCCCYKNHTYLNWEKNTPPPRKNTRNLSEVATHKKGEDTCFCHFY